MEILLPEIEQNETRKDLENSQRLSYADQKKN